MSKNYVLPPQKFRELVFLLLFSTDSHESDLEELFATVGHELKVSQPNVKLAWEKVEEIQKYLVDIDEKITEISTSYDFFRIQKVELAILRLAFYELLFEKKLSVPIIIAEAKRIAKKFATEDAASFCQALIDAVVKEKKS